MNFNNINLKSIDGIWTLGRRMMDSDETAELWLPPISLSFRVYTFWMEWKLFWSVLVADRCLCSVKNCCTKLSKFWREQILTIWVNQEALKVHKRQFLETFFEKNLSLKDINMYKNICFENWVKQLLEMYFIR